MRKMKKFSDVSDTHWAYPNIQGLAKNQITFGYANGRFGIKGKSRVLLVQSGQSFGKQFEASIWLKGWESAQLEESYRIPVITYELFKFYFEKDADREFNYYNKNSIPEKFTANGRECEVLDDEVGGNLILKSRKQIRILFYIVQ